jgi:uncharacterized protein (TIGR02231 family)
MATPIATQITAVTVYTDRALVTRSGTIQLTGTETTLVMPNLPITLDSESVRMSGKGSIPVKLQGVTVEHEYTTEPVAARVAELTADIERLETEKRRTQSQIDSLDLQSDFIKGLREKTEASFSRGLARQEIAISDTLDLLGFIGSKHIEYAHAKEDFRQQQEQLQKQLSALCNERDRLQHPQSKESYQLNIAIEPSGVGEFHLDVTYVVGCAYWNPLYDLRVQTEQKNLQLSYLAEITQTTGEDWSNVSLTLSTAKPGLGTIPPKLDPWYIDVIQPKKYEYDMMFQERARYASEPVAAMAAAPVSGGASRKLSQAEAEEIEDPEFQAEAEIAVISQQGGVVTFQLGGGGNIPSDGNPHKATILYDNFPCQFAYVTMPHLVSFAYLQAQVKSRADSATLLAGKANIFRDDTFVGTTHLEHIAPGQEFKLNLGVDEGIQLERELVERQVDKKFMGGNRRITYAYRILITNLLNKNLQLELNDRIPHSRNEQIKVKLTKSTPQIQLGELGRLQWMLDLPARGKVDVFYQFTIEHPTNLRIIGLDV